MKKKILYMAPEAQEIELLGKFDIMQTSPDVNWNTDDDFDEFAGNSISNLLLK